MLPLESSLPGFHPIPPCLSSPPFPDYGKGGEGFKKTVSILETTGRGRMGWLNPDNFSIAVT
jgi:hypothetical protein